MDIEEVNSLWAQDCKIDELNLGSEASKIPRLHNKYFILYSRAGLKLKKMKSDLKLLEHAKYEYYTGTMSEEDLKTRGWKPNPLKILRADINRYIETDAQVVTLSLKIDYQASIVQYLEDIVKQINNRNFVISNNINWIKFQAGG